jgi:hypothetical protein
MYVSGFQPFLSSRHTNLESNLDVEKDPTITVKDTFYDILMFGSTLKKTSTEHLCVAEHRLRNTALHNLRWTKVPIEKKLSSKL